LLAAGAKNVEQFFSTMSRQLTEHEWTVVKSAGDELSQLATFYRHWVQAMYFYDDYHKVRCSGPLLTQVQSVQCTAGPCSDGLLLGVVIFIGNYR